MLISMNEKGVYFFTTHQRSNLGFYSAGDITSFTTYLLLTTFSLLLICCYVTYLTTVLLQIFELLIYFI